MEKKLQELGLTEYESKVWLALIKHGILDAKQIAVYSGVPQNRVYETIETLRRYGFVDIIPGLPKKFEAFETDTALKNWLSLKEQDFKDLGKDVKILSAELKKIEHVPSKEEVRFWTVTGSREEIGKKRLELLQLAKKNKKIMVAATRPPEREFAYKKAIRELAGRARTQVLYDISWKKSPELVKWIQAAHQKRDELRFCKLPLHMKISIIDNELAYIESTYGPEEQWYLIWTNSFPIVQTLENYFDLLWKSAEL